MNDEPKATVNPVDWNFVASIKTSSDLRRPVDEVGEWFLADMGWSSKKAYDCNDLEIRRQSFDFEWFEHTDGTVILDGFIDSKLSREDATEIVRSIFTVLRAHDPNCSMEFYDAESNLITDDPENQSASNSGD